MRGGPSAARARPQSPTVAVHPHACGEHARVHLLSLDLTTQVAILELIRELAARRGMAMLLITHDLALAGERADRIVVMHAGHVVEAAPMAEPFRAPRHPYTARLIASTPRQDHALEAVQPIAGSVPDLRSALPVCRFSAPCDRRIAACDEAPLPLVAVGPGHVVACRVPLAGGA